MNTEKILSASTRFISCTAHRKNEGRASRRKAKPRRRRHPAPPPAPSRFSPLSAPDTRRPQMRSDEIYEASKICMSRMRSFEGERRIYGRLTASCLTPLKPCETPSTAPCVALLPSPSVTQPDARPDAPLPERCPLFECLNFSFNDRKSYKVCGSMLKRR